MTELILRKYAPTTIEKLFDGSVPQRRDIEVRPEIYEWFARQSIFPYLYQKDLGVKQYFLIGPLINGLGLNALMYFTAPDKSNGYDTFDLTKGDWVDLYDRGVDPVLAKSQSERLARHRQIPGWSYYERKRLLYHKLLVRDSTKQHPRSYRMISENLVIMPSWQTEISDNNPQRQWLYEESEVGQKLIRDARWSNHQLPSNPNQFDSVTGTLFMAGWCGTITANWPKRLNYDGSAKGQFMKPTQTLPLTLWKGQELFSAEIFPLVENYCNSAESITVS